MKDFLYSIKFKILVGLVILLAGFMLFQAASGSYASLPAAFMGVIVQPLQRLSSNISNSTSDFFTKFLKAGEIQKENEELKKQLNELNQKVIDLDKYKNENEQLKEFLQIKELQPDLKLEPASIIGRDVSYNFYSFTIDKGTLHNISVKDPVIAPGGLVGVVSQVGPTFSIVTTIMDVSINVGAYNARTRATGIITGSVELAKNGCTKLTLLPRDTPLSAGDIIETSGIGGLFPKGLIIGKTKSIQPETSGVSMYAVIESTVDVKEISDVVVITDFLGQGSGQPSESKAAE